MLQCPRALIRSLQKSLRRRGLTGTLVQVGKEIGERLREHSPSRRQSRARRLAADSAFDEQYGVDTGGVISLSHLQIGSPTWQGGCAYQGIDPGLFRESFGRVPLRYEEFVFVDLGSGKGRALMLAAELPFSRIIGVEFASQLHCVAVENIAQFREKTGRGDQIELFCTDAVAFPIPKDKLVLYFYNPFEQDVMARVIENIRQSYADCPRELYVVYLTPYLEAMWADVTFLRKIASTKACAIWQSTIV